MARFRSKVELLSLRFGAGLFGLFVLFVLAQAAWGQQAGRIEGVVRDPDGKAIAGVRVVLQENDPPANVEAQTNTDGTFVLAVAAGQYKLTLGKPGYGGIEDSLTLSPGETKHCELVLRPAEASNSTSNGSLSETIQLDDRPSFTVAGMTDSTGSGGHGSETRMRTGETLARETANLPPRSNKSSNTENSETSVAATQASESELRAAVLKAPRNFEANRRLGEFYFDTQNFREAIAPLETAHQVQPSDYSAGLYLALAYKACEKFSAARSSVTRALADHGDLNSHEQAELRRLLGDLDEKLNDPLAAEREYQRASALDATEQNYFAWGAELLLHGAAAPAAEVFGKGVRLHHESARMLAGLGAALYTGGSAEEAAQRLCEATDIDRTNPTPYLFLGKMQEASSSALPCAEATLARYAQDQPDSPLANYYYGLAVWRRDRGSKDSVTLQRAEKLFRKASDLDPKLDAAYVALGDLYLSRADTQQAIASYEKATAANPSNSRAHYGLGLAYRRIGQNDRAESEIQQYNLLEKREAAAVERRRSEVGQFLFYLNNQPAGGAATSNSVSSPAK